MGWATGPGVVELPDGVRLRGAALREAAHGQTPDLRLLLAGAAPEDPGWPHRWVRWRDFRIPADRRDARAAFEEAHRRAAAGDRVEIACRGGCGRTGTAIACIAQLGGVPAAAAVAWTRAAYHRRAVETPGQRRYARRFSSR